MAISFIAADTAQANSITIPAHQAGDLIIICAANHPSTSVVVPPAGWIRPPDPASPGVSSAGQSTLYAKIAKDNATVSGTWTNAVFIAVLVYRFSDGTPLMGSYSAAGGTLANLNFDYPAILARNCSTFSGRWGIRALLAAVNDIPATPPSGWSRRTLIQGASTGTLAVFDSNGAIADGAIAAATVTETTGTIGNRRMLTAEIMPLDITIGGPAGFTGIRGTHRTLGT